MIIFQFFIFSLSFRKHSVFANFNQRINGKIIQPYTNKRISKNNQKMQLKTNAFYLSHLIKKIFK